LVSNSEDLVLEDKKGGVSMVRTESIRMATKIGAVLGAIGFFVFGLVPAFYFGSYGALVLWNHLFGVAEPTVVVRLWIAIGIIIGLASALSVGIVVGAILGTSLGYVIEALSHALRPEPEKAPEPSKTR